MTGLVHAPRRAGVRGSIFLALALLAVSGIRAVAPGDAAAAESDFVGVLALVVEDEDVARQLGLDSTQREKLLKLVNAREEQVLELAMELRDLPPEERQRRLQPFRMESEKQGLELLRPDQRARLERIRIAKLGLASLAEPKVAERLKLSAEQHEQVLSLLQERQQRMATSDTNSLPLIKNETEQRLAALLSDEQRAAWQAIESEPPAPPAGALPATVTAEAPPADSSAGETPATEPAAAPGETPMPEAAQAAQTSPEAAPPGESTTSASPSDDWLAGPSESRPEPQVEETRPPIPLDSVRLNFSFRHQPWENVLDWLAEQADLSLTYETLPLGTFNYVDREREYTLGEAIDVINRVLSIKGYLLVRRDRMLVLVNLEDEIPPNLVSTVPVEELEERGEFELVRVLFDLDKLDPAEAKTEIEQLLGPQGSVVVLAQSRQILVTETAGRLRTIRRVIDRVESPAGIASGKLNIYQPKHVLADEVVVVLRQLLDIEAEANATSDGSLHFALDPLGTKIFFSGTPQMLAKVETILQSIDASEPGAYDQRDEPLQLEVYPITNADPQSVLKVIQTLLEGSPGVRLDLDPTTNNLIVMARTSEHATIQATLKQMQSAIRRIEVIPLRTVDPSLAALSIKKMFGEGSKENATAPTVDPDLASRQLLVYGTDAQIVQIKALLGEMGETAVGEGGGDLRTVRMLPLGSDEAEAVLELMQQIWPGMRKNKIEVVTPSAVISTMRVGSPEQSVPAVDQLFQGLLPATPPLQTPRPPIPQPPIAPPQAPPSSAQPESSSAAPPAEKSVSNDGPVRSGWGRFTLVSATIQPDPDTAPPDSTGVAVVSGAVLADPAAEPSEPAQPPAPEPSQPAQPPAAEPEPSASTQAAPAFQPVQPTEPIQPAQPPAPIEPPALPQVKGRLEMPAAAQPAPKPSAPSPAAPAAEPAPIVVSIGPGGLMIASQDVEALNAFEDLITTLSAGAASSAPRLKVFYLVHAKAQPVSETLDAILGGGTIATSSDSGGSLLGDLATNALGGVGGGIVGSLLGLGMGGGSITPTGSIQITPDSRLNALIVQANSADLNMIQQLLVILDQSGSPEEVLANAKPRPIPLLNMQADEAAEIVKTIYQEQMVGATAGGGGGRPPSPQEFMEALRGGGGGRSGRGGRGSSTQDVEKMSVAVDARANALIVSAPEALFQEVREFVEQLDKSAAESNNDAMSVVTLERMNSAAVQKALQAIVGDSVKFSSSQNRPAQGGSRTSSQPGGPPSSGDSAEDMRRRIEFFRAMQERAGGGGPPFGGSPFGGGRSGGGSPFGGGRPSSGGSRGPGR